MTGTETLYTSFLILALVLNGVALTGATPLHVFFAPLRETRLVSSAVSLDTLMVPFLVIGLAMLLGLDDITIAGLVIVVAASAGPIGVALARIARGDVALAVTLVTGIGLLNLLTVPLLSGLLLPDSVPLPVGPVLTSLASLLVLPLLGGRLFNAVLVRLRTSAATQERLLQRIGQGATLCLAAAVSVAMFLEPDAVLAVLKGPVTLIAIITMILIMVLARVITPDAARRRTIAVVINARAVGLALTLTALHFGDVEGLRATVLAYGGLTQAVPILIVLGARRWERVRSS